MSGAKSLFPAYSSFSKNDESKNSNDEKKPVEALDNLPKSLFPCMSTSSDLYGEKSVESTSQLPLKCESFPAEIVFQKKSNHQTEEILISSSDSDASSCILISSSDDDSISDDLGEKRKHRSSSKSKKRKKDKKKKKSKKKKSEKSSKRHRSSKDTRHHKRSRTPENKNSIKQPVDEDNSYLEYLPRGRANFLEDIPNLKSEHAFRIDRRPDGNNRAFNSLYHVPRYLPKDVIDLTKSTNKDEKETKPKPKIKRYFNKSKKISSHLSSNKLDDNQTNFIYPKENFSQYAANLDFIPLLKNVSIDSNVQSQDSAQFIRFKSLETESDNNNTDICGPKKFPNRYQLIHELTSDFNRSLQDDYSDVERWIDFICFQDLIYSSNDPNFKANLTELEKQTLQADELTEMDEGNDSNTAKKRFRNKLRQYCAEKQLSICEKALDKNRRSVELHLTKLKLLSAFFPEFGKNCADIDREWKNLCFLFPTVAKIWFEWIRFSVRGQSVINFRAHSRTRKIFRQAIHSLNGKLLEGTFQSHQIDDNIELVLVDLIDFCAQFFISIDQTEKAIALYQALVEFNLYTPNEIDFSYSLEDWFDLFEQFWDSGVSRIGEYGSVSWKQFRSLLNQNPNTAQNLFKKDERNFTAFNHQDQIDQCENEILNSLLSDTESDAGGEYKVEDRVKAQIWLHFERLRYSLHWIPASAGLPLNQSMEDIEDPERVVLSDEDLKPFLFRLRQTESKYYLVLKFIQFSGVRLLTFALDSAPSTSRFEKENVLSNVGSSLADYCRNQQLFESQSIGSSQYRCFSYSERFVLRKFGLDSIFSYSQKNDYGITLFGSDELSKKCSESTVTSRNAFIDNLFTVILEHYKLVQPKLYKNLMLIWIQHKLQLFRQGTYGVKFIRKFIKDFLREEINRNCLDLWNIYCTFEFEQNPATGGERYFLQTIQLTLATVDKDFYSESYQNLLRFTLGFVRCALNLDMIVDHFILHHHNRHRSNGDCCLVGENIQNKQSTSTNNSIDQQAEEKILKVLCAVICQCSGGEFDSIVNNSLSSVAVIRAKSKLESECIGNEQKTMEQIIAMVFIIYLTKDIDSVVDYIEQLLLPDSSLTSSLSNGTFTKSNIERSIFLLYIQLMLRHYLYEDNGGGRVQRLRGLVIRALATSESDPLFLSLLVTIEVNCNVFFRVRRYFTNFLANREHRFESYLLQRYHLDHFKSSSSSTSLTKGNMATTMTEIWNVFLSTLHSELLILDKATVDQDLTIFDLNHGVLNRIRSLFERVLNYKATYDGADWNWITGGGGSGTLEHCPTIWRLFLRFELKCKQKNKAKAVLYRAIQNCPNHKPLYLDGINFFPELLQEFVDIMMDKQLRIRTTIEEIDLFSEDFFSKKNKDKQTSNKSTVITENKL